MGSRTLSFDIEAENRGRDRRESGGRHAGRPAILVVDEEPSVRRVSVAMLRALGFRAEAVADAERARESLRRCRYAVVVLDTATGRARTVADEVLRLARRQDPAPGVILMAGGEIPSLQGLSFELLAKPFGLPALAEAVEASLSSASALSARPP